MSQAALSGKHIRLKTSKRNVFLTKNARDNGFLVELQLDGYTDETTPGWRETLGWSRCLEADKTST